jgi:hypothetical protein
LAPDGGAAWRVVSLVAVLTTSAVVANRRVSLFADDGEREWFRASMSGDQAASLATKYSAYTGADRAGSSTLGLVTGLPVNGLLLRPGHRLRAETSAIDVGDQWSLITVVVDETLSSRQVVGDATEVNPLDFPE